MDIKKYRDWLDKKKVIEESLSAYWENRCAARAARAGREYPNPIDQEWARKQQLASESMSTQLASLYEEEIQMSEDLSKTIEELMNKVKEDMLVDPDKKKNGLVKKKKNAKRKDGKRILNRKFLAPTAKNLKTRPKPGPNPYTDPEYRKTKFKSRMDYLSKKGKAAHVGDIAPMTEGKYKLPIFESKELKNNDEETLKRIADKHVGYMEISDKSKGFSCGDCRSLNDKNFCINPDVKASVSPEHGCCNYFYPMKATVTFPKEEKGNGNSSTTDSSNSRNPR